MPPQLMLEALPLGMPQILVESEAQVELEPGVRLLLSIRPCLALLPWCLPVLPLPERLQGRVA